MRNRILMRASDAAWRIRVSVKPDRAFLTVNLYLSSSGKVRFPAIYRRHIVRGGFAACAGVHSGSRLAIDNN